jgi:NAD(P)-dependent dehydrogenase (short-subunit alcohol dehydrogenase family)
VLTLNLQRVFTITQKLLPLLRAAALQGGKNDEVYNDPARIINVSHLLSLVSNESISHLLQIGSVEGLTVPPHETYAYGASKAALHHLSRLFGGRLGWEGINSNTIACGEHSIILISLLINNVLIGPFPTKSKTIFIHLLHRFPCLAWFIVIAVTLERERDRLIDENPSRRTGTPEDVAGTALFLSSRAGAYVNGATIALDGGYMVAMDPRGKL